MGSNPDYLNDLESFLDNPASLMSTSPNQTAMSPMGQTNTMSNGVGVRDRLRHHLNGEKRKLEDASDVMPKTQRTDDHSHMILDSLEHDHAFKSEDMKVESDLKDEQPQTGFGGQGGLLAQALMDKRPSSTNGHLNSPAGFFGVGSPRPVGSPGVLAPPGSPDMMALKQQIDAIKNTPSLSEEQRNAKITEFIRQHPQLKRRILMHSKMNNEKMRQTMGQDLLMQRDQVPGGNMMVQDFGSGYPPNSGNNNENAFMPGPYMDNSGMQGFAGPGGPAVTSAPRNRGRSNLPPANMNNMYPGPMQSEMWDMGNKCMPGQMPTQQHLHPPPQYPYRQPVPGPRPNNMMSSIGPSCYNSPQSEYMAAGMYGQQQPMYPGQRGGVGVMGEPLYPTEPMGPGPMGVRGFNPPGYPGGGMRMVNPAYPADGFQNDYTIPIGGRNVRHPDFMYHQQQQQQQQQQQHQHRSMNPQHSMGFGPQQHMQHQRGLTPSFGMATSPRLPGSIGQISPVMSPPMHSPATAQMPMGTPNGQPTVYNNSSNNNNGNTYSMQGSSSNNNGFHFNDEFPGPPIQSPGILGSSGIPEDTGIDSLLGPDDGMLASTVPAAANTSWKLNSAELRRDLLQRLTNALKDSQSGAGIDSEASAMEEEAFNSCDTEESYFHRLAQMLATKFSTIQENQPQTPTSYPDSTTLQDSVSCPKLSSSTDGATDTSGSDILAKANPILAESLAATNDDNFSAASAPGVDSKDSELFSSSSSASSSPVSSSVTMATASMSSSSPSLTPSILSNGCGTGNPPLRKADNFHRPNTDSGEKGLHRTVNGRRPSGKGNTNTPTATNGNNNNNNNPHSVDSGIGSPRSTTSTSLYSPKLHGTSPSLVQVANLESSPGKLS